MIRPNTAVLNVGGRKSLKVGALECAIDELLQRERLGDELA